MFSAQRKSVGAPHPDPEQPHPYVGRAALFSMVVAMLLIVWARVEILGTHDFERTLTDENVPLAKVCVDRLEALAFNRWATGFSQ